MTYYAGDDSTITIPVTDTNGGTLDLGTAVVAHNTAGDQQPITGASWQAAAGPHPTIQGATIRSIVIPLTTLPAGLWGLRLTVTNAPDLFLGNVVIV